MNRRDFLASAAAPAVLRGTAAAKPNIIFILADDLGYGDVGCYGQRKIKTPVLDRMAADGMRFTSAYSGSTVCAPSRCSLMTGKHMGHATVRGNKPVEMALKPGEATVASTLKQGGYRTALSGKWGLGGFDVDGHPQTRGFDQFFGYLNQVHAHQSFPDHLWDGRSEYFLKGNWFNQRKVFSNDLFTERAIDFVEKSAPNPFFLYLTYTIPHANNELGQVSKAAVEAPDQGIYKNESWPEVERNFASIITRMDTQIGQLFDTLRRKGVDENTLIVFSSDNGPHKEGHHDPNFFRSSGPLRGTKRDLYEGGIRVPAIARWPGRIRSGAVSDYAWAFWDFLPTAAEAAGVRTPGEIDGRSILPVLRGQTQEPHESLYWEFYEGGFQQAIRQGDWKLVRQAPTFKSQLFNLRQDIGEQHDVAAANAATVKQLEALMARAHTDHPEFPTRGQVKSVPF